MPVHANPGDCVCGKKITLVSKNFEPRRPKKIKGGGIRSRFSAFNGKAKIIDSIKIDALEDIEKNEARLFLKEGDSLEGRKLTGFCCGRIPKGKVGTSTSRSGAHSNQERHFTNKTFLTIVETWCKEIFDGAQELIDAIYLKDDQRVGGIPRLEE